MASGRRAMRSASRQVRSLLWLRSTSRDRACRASTTSAPKALRPVSSATVAPAADGIAAVVGQLHDAHAEVGEQRDALDPAAQHLGVLEAVDHADLAGLARRIDVGRFVDLAQRRGPGADEGVPAGDVGHGRLEGLGAAGHMAERDVDGGEAGGLRIGQRAAVDMPAGAAVGHRLAVAGVGRGADVGVVEHPQRVDDEVHGLGRSSGSRRRQARPTRASRPSVAA